MLSTPTRGKGRIHPLLRKLNDLAALGPSSLGGAASRFAAQTRKNGVVCVLSDFLTGERLETIAPLAGLGHQVELIQILAPEEANPQLTGDLELVDAETGASEEVSMGQAVLRRYHQRLGALQSELKTFARRCGGDFHVCVTSQPLREFILGPLRTARLVR
jgi:hypothetical protein